MAPKAKTLSDDQLDELDEEFGSGIDDELDGDVGDDDVTTDPVDEEPEAEADVDPEVETDEEPESFTVSQLAEKFGFQLEEADDEVASLEKFFGQTSQLQQFARQAAQERQQLQQQLAYYQNQQYQQPQQTNVPPEVQEQKKQELTGMLKHWQNVPEFHTDWLSYVTYDENQNLVSKPGADPTLPQKIEAYNRWERQAQQAILGNPQQFVFEAIQANPSFKDAIQEQIQQAVFGLRDNLESQRIANERSSFIFQENAQGQRELTPAGQAYVTAVQDATAGGVTDNATLDKIGMTAATPYLQIAQYQRQQQEEAQQKPPETPAQNKKRRQLEFAKKSAAKKPNRGQDKSQKRRIRNQEDFMDVALARMEKEGIDPYAKVSG